MSEREFTLEYEFEEFVDAYMAHRAIGRKAIKPWKVFLLTSACAAALAALFACQEGKFHSERLVMFGLGALLLGSLISWFPERLNRPSIRNQLRSQWEEMKLDGRKAVYRFDDDELRIQDDIAGGRVAWRDIYGWSETDKFVLIYRSHVYFYYISTAQVDLETLASLKSRLQSSPAKKL